MTPAQTLLKTPIDSSEGTRKAGFTVGGVSYQVNQAQGTIACSFTIPVVLSTDDTTGDLIISAKDFLELAP